MIRKTPGVFAAAIGAALALLLGGLVTRDMQAYAEPVALASSPEFTRAHAVTVFKSPTCTCCANWGDHLRANGFDVREEISEDLFGLMDHHEIPDHLRSCHFGILGDYVLVGHLPADLAVRLLKEKPPVMGIAVPGMPLGSPGMEHPGRKDRYDVIAFGPGVVEYVYESR